MSITNMTQKYIYNKLVMEQSDTRKRHNHTVLVAGLDHLVIAHRAARLRHIPDAALIGAVNIITEWEERV